MEFTFGSHDLTSVRKMFKRKYDCGTQKRKYKG